MPSEFLKQFKESEGMTRHTIQNKNTQSQTMKVRNRSGECVDISFDEIKNRIGRLCTDAELQVVDIDRVAIQTINGIYDGITTTELDELSARLCVSMQSIHPMYDELAGRILTSNLSKTLRRRLGDLQLPWSFSGRLEFAASLVPTHFDSDFLRFVKAHHVALDAAIDEGRDASTTFFGMRTLERSYLMKDSDGATIEMPQDLWMRVAVSIHRTLMQDTDHQERALKQVLETYDLTSRGVFTHATPTLFNAGSNHEQMSSCFLLGTEDSLESIFKTISDCAQISKWAGGIGVHFSNVRSKGSRILGTHGASDGIVPMLKVFNETARYCNQSGKRKGSIAAYLEPWHADVWEFIELRRNTGSESERARDLFLALWVPDEFMHRLERDDDWYLMSPDVCPGLVDAIGIDFTNLYCKYISEGKFVKKLKARLLWQHMMTSQLETGMPYVLFKDHINRKSNQSNIGTIRSSNLCAEVCEYSDSSSYAVCNLASIAVNRFLSPDGSFDHAELHRVAGVVTVNLNKVIDLNRYPVPETRKSNMALRPIGIGVQGFADLYCMLKLSYESEQALQLDADIMETIYHGALEASIQLAKKDGAYEGFDGSPFSKGQLQMDLWDKVPTQSGRYDWEGMRQDVMRHGTRNSLLTALMPTASTSQLLGNNECFEPFHSNMFKRTTLAGEFLVVNKHLMHELISLGLWNDDLRAKLMASDGSIQQMFDLPASMRSVYKTVWEVPMKSVIDHALRRGPYIDQSQSMNLFYDRPSFVKLGSALIYGWRNGIKTGVYYLRSKPAVEAAKQSSSPSIEKQVIDGQSPTTDPVNTTCTLGCSSCGS